MGKDKAPENAEAEPRDIENENGAGDSQASEPLPVRRRLSKGGRSHSEAADEPHERAFRGATTTSEKMEDDTPKESGGSKLANKPARGITKLMQQARRPFRPDSVFSLRGGGKRDERRFSFFGFFSFWFSFFLFPKGIPSLDV